MRFFLVLQARVARSLSPISRRTFDAFTSFEDDELTFTFRFEPSAAMRLILLLILFFGVPLFSAQNVTLARRSVDPELEHKIHEEALREKCEGAKPCVPGLVLPIWEPQVSVISIVILTKNVE